MKTCIECNTERPPGDFVQRCPACIRCCHTVAEQVRQQQSYERRTKLPAMPAKKPGGQVGRPNGLVLRPALTEDEILEIRELLDISSKDVGKNTTGRRKA